MSSRGTSLVESRALVPFTGGSPASSRVHTRPSSGASFADARATFSRTASRPRASSDGTAILQKKASIIMMSVGNPFNHTVSLTPIKVPSPTMRRTRSESSLRRNTVDFPAKVRIEGAEPSECLATALMGQTPWPDMQQMGMVRKLNFDRANLDPADVSTLPAVLRHTPYLSELNLSHNLIGPAWTSVLVAALEHTMDLRVLEMYHCGIVDVSGLDKAMAKTNIVNQSGCRLSFGLKVLNLGCNELTPAGMRTLPLALKEAPELETLRLDRHRLGHKGSLVLASCLMQAPTLQNLHLPECQLGPRGAIGLAQGLMHTKELRELHLACNAIGREGIEELIEPFKVTRKIAVLDMSWNYLGQAVYAGECPVEMVWFETWGCGGGILCSPCVCLLARIFASIIPGEAPRICFVAVQMSRAYSPWW